MAVNKKKYKYLLKFMAQACESAQDHMQYCLDEVNREDYLQCTTYQISCWLCHNTKDGRGGVETNIVLEDLISEFHSFEWWKRRLQNLVDEFGGWR